MPALAAIDIGSNAMRLLIASVSPSRHIETIESIREPVRLGTAVFSDGVIPEITLARTVSAFERFRAAIDRHRVVKVRAYGTSALREARNSFELKRRVKEATGIDIEIISGEEEARLVYLAVSNAVPLKRGVALIVDIGGGSVELSIVYKGKILTAESFKAGTVRLLQIFKARDRAPELFSRMVDGYAHTIRSRLRRELGRREIDICIGTGGNFDALSDLRPVKRRKGQQALLRRSDLDRIAKSLIPLSLEERIKKFNLKPDRADVIVPALTITRAILQNIKANEILTPGVGLKEGMLLDMSPLPHAVKDDRERFLSYAEELGQRFAYDADHGRAVARIAAALFKQTAQLHKIPSKRGVLLELAALLHDVGEFVHTHDHHKHSFYIIAHSPFVGLTPHERVLVATIARYHRKSAPKVDHPEFKSLSRVDRELVRKCAALLRIADALDNDRTGTVKNVNIRLMKGAVLVRPTPLLEPEVVRWALERKSSLFEQVFGRRLLLAEKSPRRKHR